MSRRPIRVSLTPGLVRAEQLDGCLAVVLDVLRATTTMLAALHAGCRAVYPCATLETARDRARTLAFEGKVILAGERDGLPVPGFDAGNSPREFTPERCQGAFLVLTTTNGTAALLACRQANRVIPAALSNLAAVREHLLGDARPVHVVCAGESGGVSWEDTLVAGALVDGFPEADLDDGARLARSAWHASREDLPRALRSGQGGFRLTSLGYDEDIDWAARLNRCALVPELLGDPPRITVQPSKG